MLVAALFGRFGVPFDGGGLLFDLFAVDVVEGDGIGRQAGDLQVIDIIDGAGILEQGRHVGGDEVAVFGLAHDQRAVLAHGVDHAGAVGKQHAQRVGAAHVQHHAGDGLERVAGGLAGIIVVDQLGHDLGIGLGGKLVAAVHQAVFQLLEVFDDAVVYHGDLFVAAVVGVGVGHRRLAVGGPARVADAAGTLHRVPAVRHIAEHAQAALGLDHFDLAGGVLHGDAGRIIAAVFQLGQAVQQNGRGLPGAGKANDSTHKIPSCKTGARPRAVF